MVYVCGCKLFWFHCCCPFVICSLFACPRRSLCEWWIPLLVLPFVYSDLSTSMCGTFNVARMASKKIRINLVDMVQHDIDACDEEQKAIECSSSICALLRPQQDAIYQRIDIGWPFCRCNSRSAGTLCIRCMKLWDNFDWQHAVVALVECTLNDHDPQRQSTESWNV